MRPDRVVCGVESERAREVLRGLYRPLYINETPILFTAVEPAELIKYAANAFLATKITFINEIASMCEKVDVNVQEVARGIGLAGRKNGSATGRERVCQYVSISVVAASLKKKNKHNTIKHHRT